MICSDILNTLDKDGNEFKTSLKLAKEIAQNLVQTVKRGDLIEKSNTAFDLVDALDPLWDLRYLCSEDWADLVNHLQGVLRHKDYNKLCISIAVAIEHVIEILQVTNLTSHDLSDALEILLRSGLDPWRPIVENGKEDKPL